jgi:hypothetical protein
MTHWAKGDGGDSHLMNIQVNGGALGQDGMIGLFTDDAGQNYFMLTNLYCGENLTSAQSATTFQLAFDGDTTSLLELDPLTGLTNSVALDANHVLTLTLGGGQGALFKYDTGPFAGVPEPTGLPAIALLLAFGFVLPRPSHRRQSFSGV